MLFLYFKLEEFPFTVIVTGSNFNSTFSIGPKPFQDEKSTIRLLKCTYSAILSRNACVSLDRRTSKSFTSDFLGKVIVALTIERIKLGKSYGRRWVIGGKVGVSFLLL